MSSTNYRGFRVGQKVRINADDHGEFYSIHRGKVGTIERFDPDSSIDVYLIRIGGQDGITDWGDVEAITAVSTHNEVSKLVSFEQLQEQRRQLAEMEAQFQETVHERRPSVVEQLRDYITRIETLVKEATELAESADLVFYYSSGYQEWSCEEKENWSSSSADC